MERIQFQGKIFYPLTWNPAADAQPGEQTMVNRKGKTVPVFSKADFQVEEMRPGLGGLLNGQETGSVGEIYYFDRREVLDLPRCGQKVTFYPRTGSEMEIALGKIGFVLFETGVAFLEMDVALSAADLDAVMNTTYYLCEVKDPGNCLSYSKITYDPADKTKTETPVTMSLKSLFLRCVEFLPECGHFEDKPLSDITAKPLLYSYYLLPEAPNDLEALTGNIAQNYKRSYKGADSGHSTLTVFENSRWCVSANGAANVTSLVEDETTNAFFQNAFPSKWEKEYLFLFLQTIHQKYAVLKYLGALADSIWESEKDGGSVKEALMKSLRLQEQCETLKMRCFFDLPSRVDHINHVYRFFGAAMQVPAYLASLNRKLEESVKVCRSFTQRVGQIKDLERQIRGDKTEIKITLLTAAVTCLTFFQACYTTFLHLLHWELGEIKLDAVIPAVTFVATISAVVVNISKLREEIRDLKDEIKKLKALHG